MRALAGLAFIAFLLAEVPAYAETVVVGVGGSATGAEKALALSAARARLEESARDSRELDAARASSLLKCVQGQDAGCVAEGIKALSAENVLVLEVSKDIDRPTEKSLVVTGWLIDGKTAAVVVSDRRFCERCSSESLSEITGEFVGALLKEASARAGSTILVIRSTPSGARVEIDGSAVGVTDLEYGVYPGPHAIRIEKPGFKPSLHDIVAEPNRRTEVTAVLVATKKPPPGRHARFRVWKWATLAAGAAALAAGTWLIIADKPGEVDGHLQPRERNSLWPGVAVAAFGAATLGVSVYMFWSDGRSPGARAPGRSVASGGAFVFALGGSF